jgi:Enoyl-CoA hydratase/isomerase
MSGFDAYRASFPNAQLTRSKSGVLEVALHTDGGTLVFNGHTHEQFIDLFHAIGSDRDNRVVILTGNGNAFMETISPEGFDFFTPQGYDKIYREGRKVLMNILDIEAPLIAAVNGPARLHSEFVLRADIILATPSTVFQDKPHLEFGMVPGDGVHLLWQEAIGTIRGRYFHRHPSGARRPDGQGMGRRQRDRCGRPAPSPRARDCRGISQAAAVDHKVHAHRADSETAAHHRRRRDFGPCVGGHQRG